MAICPASRAASRNRSRSALPEWMVSTAGKGHAFDQERWACRAVVAIEIARRDHPQEHVLQVRGDGDFRDRPGEFAILDPETRCAAAVFAGHHVDALTEHLG